jgi:hypothetical protein
MSRLLTFASRAYPAAGREEVVAALTEHYGPQVPFRETRRVLLHGLRLGTIQRTPTTSAMFGSATVCTLTIWLTAISSGNLLTSLFRSDGSKLVNLIMSVILFGWLAVVRRGTRWVRSIVGISTANLFLAASLPGFLSRRVVDPIEFQTRLLFLSAFTLVALFAVLGLLSPLVLGHRFSKKLHTGLRLFIVLLLLVGWAEVRRRLPDGFSAQGQFHLGGVFILFVLLVASVLVPNRSNQTVGTHWPRWPFIIGVAMGLLDIESSISNPALKILVIATVIAVLVGLVCVATMFFVAQPVPLMTMGLALLIRSASLFLLGISPTPLLAPTGIALLIIGASNLSARRILLRT